MDGSLGRLGTILFCVKAQDVPSHVPKEADKMQQGCQAEETVFCQAYLESGCKLHESVVVAIPPTLQKIKPMGKQQAWIDLYILDTRALTSSSRLPLFIHVKQEDSWAQVPLSLCFSTVQQML